MINLSLCPYASLPYRSGRVRLVVCGSDTEEEYLATIKSELERLLEEPDKIETTLIAAEKVLGDFLDFNDFLSAVEDLLQRDDLALHFQMASFHPQYQFAGVEEADPGNYSNRAPYPVVQWLRTETVAKAVDSSDTLAIPQANIKKLQSMELSELRLLFPWVK